MRSFVLDQLYPVYQAVATARHSSPALRSANRFFLDLVGGEHAPQRCLPSPNSRRATARRAPATSCLRLRTWIETTISRAASTSTRTRIGNGVNDYGIDPARFYNVTNIAAYQCPGSRDALKRFSSVAPAPAEAFAVRNCWPTDCFVSMSKVPATDGDWATGPYEAQYLKLHDVTP